MKYGILSHTADLKIKVFGKDKKELFANAMIGMFKEAGYMATKEIAKKEVEVESTDLESLLIDFLNEVLYVGSVNKEIYQKIIYREFSDIKIRAELLGKKIKRFNLEIKSATYHNLEIKKTKNYWQAIILFDV